MSRRVGIIAASLMSAVATVGLAWLLGRLARLRSPQGEPFFWFSNALELGCVVGSIAIGYLSWIDREGPGTKAELRLNSGWPARSTAALALLLCPGAWIAGWALAPGMGLLPRGPWQQELINSYGEAFLGLPFVVFPLSVCAVLAGQIWRATSRPMSIAGAILGAAVQYALETFGSGTEGARGCAVVLLAGWVWPLLTVLVASVTLYLSRRHST